METETGPEPEGGKTKPDESMVLDRILRRVRALIDRAEHVSTPPEEAATARQMADSLMLQYAIQEAMLDRARPAASRTKPMTILVALSSDPTLNGYMARMANDIATHCSCKIRHYVWYGEGAWHSKVYGYEGDLRYFEVLYTVLRLHMVEALRPQPDPAKSIEENSYVLHHAGLNWFDIAKMYGWIEATPMPGEPKLMYLNTKTGERRGWSQAIAQYKKAYAREIERRGERAVHIAPAATETFRINAASGYVVRIDERLREIRKARQQVGSALALRRDALDELFREENEDLFTPTTKVKGRVRRARTVPFNPDGYAAGINRANTAALNNPVSNTNPTREVR